jgi:uncharacterized protein (DUF488 family)
LIDIYTIGHSNHALEQFLDLLQQHAIELLVDVRSRPFSQYAPHFNAAEVEAAVRRARIGYRFAGRELGGRPDGDEYYDADDHVLYDRVAESAAFRAGIEQLIANGRRSRTAIMCSEENPAGCHRRLLVGRVLAEQNVALLHIRGDGQIQSEAQLERELHPVEQLGLFEEEQEPAWRSIRPVSRRKPRPSSSEHFDEPA